MLWRDGYSRPLRSTSGAFEVAGCLCVLPERGGEDFVDDGHGSSGYLYRSFTGGVAAFVSGSRRRSLSPGARRDAARWRGYSLTIAAIALRLDYPAIRTSPPCGCPAPQPRRSAYSLSLLRSVRIEMPRMLAAWVRLPRQCFSVSEDEICVRHRRHGTTSKGARDLFCGRCGMGC